LAGYTTVIYLEDLDMDGHC